MWLIEACDERGQDYPEFIQNMPTLWPECDFYWYAFWDLNTCRSTGMSIGHIPWTAIKSYADQYELRGLQFNEFVSIIRALDDKFVGHHASS